MANLDFNTIDTLEPHALGTTDWHLVSQEDINVFANVTHDHQWIHLDKTRAEQESPYKTTIAHGFLTLSLLSSMMGQLEIFPEGVTVINYGLDKVRFLAPVASNGRIRNHAEFVSAEKKPQGVLIKVKNTVEIEGVKTPAMVAEALLLVLV